MVKVEVKQLQIDGVGLIYFRTELCQFARIGAVENCHKKNGRRGENKVVTTRREGVVEHLSRESAVEGEPKLC